MRHTHILLLSALGSIGNSPKDAKQNTPPEERSDIEQPIQLLSPVENSTSEKSHPCSDPASDAVAVLALGFGFLIKDFFEFAVKSSNQEVEEARKKENETRRTPFSFVTSVIKEASHLISTEIQVIKDTISAPFLRSFGSFSAQQLEAINAARARNDERAFSEPEVASPRL